LTANEAGLRYRADIDGIRAVAVLSVVLFHAFPKLVPGGFAGVDAFFVVSGYLITSIIVTDLDAGSFNFTEFYARRVRRLFPALVVVLAVTLALGFWLLLPEQLASLAKNTIASALFSANLMLLSETGYFGIDASLKPLLHLWSLGVEEQFYLIWPIALSLTPRRFTLALIVVVMIGSFALNVVLIGRYPDAAFYLPFTRVWELMAGAILLRVSLKNVVAREIFSVAALVGTCLILGFYNRQTPFPGWAALAPVAVAGAALLAQGSLLSRTLLSNPVAVFIGRISYPLYLWHWPLLVFGKAYPLRTLTRPELVGLVLMAFALAWLTYELIERPVRSGRFAAGTNASIAGMAATAISAVVVLAMPPRFPDEIQRLIETPSHAAPEWRQHECFLTGDDGKHDFAVSCVDADRPLIALWGDSTVAALMPGIRQQQLTRHFGLAQFNNGRGCQPVLVKSRETNDECVELNQLILRRLSAAVPDTVLMGGLWTANADKLKPTINALRAIGIRRIILLGKVPLWQGGLPNLVAAYYRRERKLLPELSSLLVDGNPDADGVIRLAAAELGIEFVSIRDTLCKDGECRTRIGDDLVTSDIDHFTPAGSKYVVEKIANTVLPEKQSKDR
jgi:peptidoglycan/LPS O-acetylase OafA/YrhL